MSYTSVDVSFGGLVVCISSVEPMNRIDPHLV